MIGRATSRSRAGIAGVLAEGVDVHAGGVGEQEQGQRELREQAVGLVVGRERDDAEAAPPEQGTRGHERHRHRDVPPGEPLRDQSPDDQDHREGQQPAELALVHVTSDAGST